MSPGPIVPNLSPPISSQGDSKQRHILAVSARSNQKDDIPHRLITRPILNVVREEEVRTLTPPTLQIVRPGSFAALVAALETHPIGYFDVVHFDLHGFISEGSPNPASAFLKFLTSDEDMDGVDEIPLSEVAGLLGRKGVDLVVLNACQSASEHGPLANIAKSIVQNGVQVAVGMRYDVLDTAAEIFTTTFYRQLVRHKARWWDAVRTARLAMRLDQRRYTEFDTPVEIQDYITPVVFSGGQLNFDDSSTLDAVESPNDVIQEATPEIYGREADILFIETQLAKSNVLLVQGSAGSGKTHLSLHLASWWKATGFVEDFGIIDCAKMSNFDAINLQACIGSALKLPSNATADVMAHLNRHRCLVFIDSLDAYRSQDETEAHTRLELRRFLRKIKKSFVILLSRHDEHWVKAAAKVTYRLSHLAMKPSLQLATKEASNNGGEPHVNSAKDLRFLEQCIFLVDGNPLAIQLMMKAHSHYRVSMKDFYIKLTDGSRLIFDADIPTKDQPRGLADAQNLIRLNTVGPAQAPDNEVDLRLLAPFWRSFPSGINVYRVLFKWAILRTVEGLPNPLGVSRRPHYDAEGFTDDERGILLLRRALPEQELSSLDCVDNVFTACEKERFFIRTNVNILGELKEHMRIHPLMTLAFRQPDYALPDWANHAIEVSFFRFWIYQSRHWPKTGVATFKWEAPRAELSYDFANYITASTYSLRVVADPGNVYMQILPIKVATGISDNPRRVHVVHDLLARLLTIHGNQLANQPQMLHSVKASTLRGGKKLTEELRSEILDARGMLEMICLLAIQLAATFADKLSDPSDYSSLLEGITANLDPHSDFADVNLPLVRASRVQIQHNQKPSIKTVEAMTDVFSLPQMSLAEADQARKSRPSLVPSSFNYHTLSEVNAATGPEEIARMERKLHDLLRDQLNGLDADRFKALIYESLSALALKRMDYLMALDHLDRAIDLAKRFMKTEADGMKSLYDCRDYLLKDLDASG
ncbi:MAG: hypothetical protein Q9195_007644 [Heterodermia aff. obscurata]